MMVQVVDYISIDAPMDAPEANALQDQEDIFMTNCVETTEDMMHACVAAISVCDDMLNMEKATLPMLEIIKNLMITITLISI